MSYRMVSKYTCSPEVLFKADCLLAIKWVSGSLKHWWCRHMLWLPIVCVCIYTHTQYIYFAAITFYSLYQSKHIAPCVQMSAWILILSIIWPLLSWIILFALLYFATVNTERQSTFFPARKKQTNRQTVTTCPEKWLCPNISKLSGQDVLRGTKGP